MPGDDLFDTTKRRGADGAPRTQLDSFRRYRPQIIVATLILIFLGGGALYNSRFTESAPQTVYTGAVESVNQQAAQPLMVDINTADAEELDELPGVGPSTAEKILEHRRTNGLFRNLDELEEVPGIGPKTLEKIRPFARV